MKNFLVLCFALSSSFMARSQYYYKDIVGTNETNHLLSVYKNTALKSVEVVSFEANGLPSKEFSIIQQLQLPEQKLTTKTYNGQQISMLVTYFDDYGRVIKTVDSTGSLVNTTSYTYSPQGLVQQISFNAMDSSRGLNETEIHNWYYNAQQQPDKMVRTINQQPSLEINFIRDEAGNITEEVWLKNKVEIDRVYYFYDDKNNLTDIVRFNKKANKLLPDFMFEHDAQGVVIQRINIPVNSSEYQIWRYQYNDKGLKTREALFDRDKQLVGKIEYRYHF